MKTEIVRSAPSATSILTQIAIESKKHWGYPDEQIEKWRSELTLTKNEIKTESVFQLNIDNKPIGFYSLWRRENNEFEIEDFWLLPKYMGKGFGRKLFNHLIKTASDLNAKNIRIVSDPNAEKFYINMGARKVDEKESSIKGRMLPILKIEL